MEEINYLDPEGLQFYHQNLIGFIVGGMQFSINIAEHGGLYLHDTSNMLSFFEKYGNNLFDGFYSYWAKIKQDIPTGEYNGSITFIDGEKKDKEVTYPCKLSITVVEKGKDTFSFIERFTIYYENEENIVRGPSECVLYRKGSYDIYSKDPYGFKMGYDGKSMEYYLNNY